MQAIFDAHLFPARERAVQPVPAVRVKRRILLGMVRCPPPSALRAVVAAPPYARESWSLMPDPSKAFGKIKAAML